MGTDNLHHKRKALHLKRKENKREEKDVILIVCEGEKTEVNYFKGFKKDLKATNVYIKQSPFGNTPDTIYKYALEEIRNHNYNKVYCVFDRDTHSNYQKILNQIKDHPVKFIS